MLSCTIRIDSISIRITQLSTTQDNPTQHNSTQPNLPRPVLIMIIIMRRIGIPHGHVRPCHCSLLQTLTSLHVGAAAVKFSNPKFLRNQR